MQIDDLSTQQWDYKGLQMLKEDDTIRVIDSATKSIICEEQINQIPLTVFSHTISGHFEQVNQIVNNNCSWEKYFTDGYYAELYRKRN